MAFTAGAPGRLRRARGRDASRSASLTWPGSRRWGSCCWPRRWWRRCRWRSGIRCWAGGSGGSRCCWSRWCTGAGGVAGRGARGRCWRCWGHSAWPGSVCRPVLWWMWALSLIPWWLWRSQGRPGLNGRAGQPSFHRGGGRGGQGGLRRRTRPRPGRPGRPDRSRAGATGRARATDPVRAGTARRGRPSHVADGGPGRDRAVPPAGLSEPPGPSSRLAERVARQALAEMRRLLGVLRSDQPAALAPQPGLADLPAHRRRPPGRGVGGAVSRPALGQVPPGVGVCAYRIVQESLSNVSRHAAGAPYASVGHDTGTVPLRVANGPGGAASGRGTSTGPATGSSGCVSGWPCSAARCRPARCPSGGFVVSAVLPLGETP